MILGLTGGLGCGKTTAARVFEKLGFVYIDCDDIIHDLEAHDKEVIKTIEGRFGNGVVKDGQVDRRVLGKRVFHDKEELKWLEGLLHPLLFRLIDEKIAKAPKLDYIVEIPILFEKKLEKKFGYTICLSSSLELQLARLTNKGMSLQEAQSRIASQMPLSEKEQRADYVITNNSTPTILTEQIKALVDELKQK